MLLVAILSFGAVCAQDNSTSDIVGDQDFEDLNTVYEVNKDVMGMLNSNEDILTAYDENQIRSDNIIVDVDNVFKGKNTTIYVIAPEATGNVNITVGENIYSPKFSGGVAKQIISDYSIGLNNVTVQYNDIVKETSFKVLDGVVTQETFEDYFELNKGVYVQSEKPYQRYKMVDCIPEGAILDFRGLINIKNVERAYTTVKGLTITSSSGDAVVEGNIRFYPECNVNHVRIDGLIYFI